MKKNKNSFMCDIFGKKSIKRLWMSIFFFASLLLGAITVIICYFCNVHCEDLIRNIFYGFLGAGLGLAAATVPENIKKWGMKGADKEV